MPREGNGGAPWENTVAAFAAARGAGADGVELDVRSAADGTLVVLHDPAIPTGAFVHALGCAELPPWLPTLAQALDTCGDLLVDIEVKAPPPGAADDVGKLADAVVRGLAATVGKGARPGSAGPAPMPSGSGSRLVTSFWPDAVSAALAAADELGLDLALGLLTHPGLVAADLVDEAARLGCRVLAPPWPQVTGELVRRCHDRGMAVLPWTVNGDDAFRAVVGAGVDGVITDEVVQTLDRRRRWRGAD